ncbi:MAG TPA: ABC transporter ATP-binding protein [Flavobacteriaceae bacterium]|jgi:iron complex transport system ATP-binding protein|nr:ABC transporter ATP-binding protein [Flavobacteriaceae bacterium]HBS10923.1 ABC transporter ATP-binding protein [Flavobacteriaceae bacterium]
MTNQDSHIIKTNNLAIGYFNRKETTCIVDDINLSLTKGNFVCVLGKNGIGKSTLLRTLTKVQPKLSGEIILDGKNLESISNPELAKKLSLVLTERIPESNLTVYELIALGRQPYTNWIGKLNEDDLQQIDWAIEQLNIKELIAKKHDELSDGQLQKVMIARALVQDTEIIILDEPTVHLDLHNTIEIFSILKKLSKDYNKTILISTHEIHLALQLADQLWLLKDDGITSGQTESLITDGSVSKLFSTDLITFDIKSKQFIINNK